MGLLSRIFRPSAAKSAEGEYRPGPWYLPITGGWLTHDQGKAWNWWQLGYDPVPGFDKLAIVEACVSRYAQTIAMCPGSHWRATSKGGRERVATSALSRVLRKPNAYQTANNFKLNLVRSLLCEGNAYALALRNDRFEVSELHLMHPRQSGPRIAETGELFYSLGGNELIERRLGAVGANRDLLTAVPARDVLHVRLHTPRNPLLGESPLTAVALDLAASNTMTAQQLAFYTNQARPSAILSTDQVLTKDQIGQLRTIWDEQSQGLNAGKTPIMAAGLKPIPLHVSAQDAQLIETLKLAKENIALAFGVPLQILGLGGTPYASTELLMQDWINGGLGCMLDTIEQEFDRLFGLAGEPTEYTELDTGALLRSAMKDRVEALARGVQGGIYAPNEARLLEGLPEVEFGDEPRVQQQVVPLSAAQLIEGKQPGETPPAPPAPPADSQPAPQAPPPARSQPDETDGSAADYALAIRAAVNKYADRVVH